MRKTRAADVRARIEMIVPDRSRSVDYASTPPSFGDAGGRPLNLTASICPFLRIAKVARGRCASGSRDLCAADPRVKRGIGPLNLGLCTHQMNPCAPQQRTIISQMS